MIVLRRLATALPSIVGVIVVTFLLTRALPGDPAAYFAGPAATEQAIEQIRHQLGLDRSLPLQFLDYVGQLARGDLGMSLSTGQPVLRELLTRLPASAELTLLGLLLSVAIAIPLGIAAALRPGSSIDHACRILATAGVSLPIFFTGLVLVYVFYYVAGWAPAPLGRLDVYYSAPPHWTGFYLIDSLIAGDLGTFRAALAQLVLPVAALAIFSLAPLARITRAGMLAALGSEFIRTARASGLPRRTHRLCLCLPQRGAAGHHDARNGVLVSARRQCAGREGLRLAGHRLLRGRGADRIGLRSGAGLRAGDGAALRPAQPVIDLVYGLLDPRMRVEA